MGRYLLPVAALLLLWGPSRPAAEALAPACADSVDLAIPQRPYVAVRRLEAENERSGRRGWLEAKTSFTDGTLSIQVLDEGGSEQIRHRVLRAALEREQELVARREAGVNDDAPRYECAEPVPDASGLMRVPLRPRRKEVSLIFGSLFLQPSTGDPVRVLGRLAKSPSFWVSHVDVDWRYERIHRDAVLPVSLTSTARVRFFGPSTFSMTYDYISVDGEPVGRGIRASR
jgi:hypothetical protein